MVVIVESPPKVWTVAAYQNLVSIRTDLPEAVLDPIVRTDANFLEVVVDLLKQHDGVVLSAFILDQPFDKKGFHTQERYPVQVRDFDGIGGVLPHRGVGKRFESTIIKLHQG